MNTTPANQPRKTPMFNPPHCEQLNLLQSLFEAMMEVEHEADRLALATIGYGLANLWREPEKT
ncbi:MAG: hypothetical protein WBC18_17720 [Ottowia sp.]|uniref:hypothetical protein n=1 Tax=Ottowia sp. TaxID=1898956 RepID=UPI003C71C92E